MYQVMAHTQLTSGVWTKPRIRKRMGSLAVNIDSTLPGVTCNVSPSTAAKSSNPVTITVTGHATDTVSGVSITGGATYSVVDEYGVTQPSGPITLQSNGNYSFTLTLPATKNVGDSSHVYTITVTWYRSSRQYEHSFRYVKDKLAKVLETDSASWPR